MADYRIYCLDGAGNIGLADWIQADTDEEAVLKARELKPVRRKCEIWHKSRLVGQLTPGGRFETGHPDNS
jgi:hypothetical protein